MKFRSSFQISRSPKEDGPRPSTSRHFKMPSLLEKQSKASLSNGVEEPKEDTKGTPTKKAMQEFFQKTHASLRAKGSNLKASGSKLEKRIPGRKTKVVCGHVYKSDSGSLNLLQVKPSSKRNSQVHVRTFDVDEELLERIFNAPEEKQASATFLTKQRMRASARKPSPQRLSTFNSNPGRA